jgi:hypothetical protein
MEEICQQQKESVSIPIYRKGDKTECGNYWGISLLSTSYNILSSIFLIMLSLYIDKIVGVKLYRLHHVVYIVFNYLCYNRQHNKQCGDIFNKCWYMSYLCNVNKTCATCFDHIIES